MATTGAENQETTQITVDNKDPREALKEFELALNEGKNPVFSGKTAKAVQKYIEKVSKQNPQEAQITLDAKEGNQILEGILKANAQGLNVVLTPQAKEALMKLIQADYRAFVQARIEAKNDPNSLMRLTQLMSFGFLPVMKEEGKKAKALISNLQKIQSKALKPVVIQSGSVSRDWSVFKEGTEKLGMDLAFDANTEEANTERETRRQELLQVLSTESHILDLSNFPKEKQIAKAQQLAPYGVKSILSVKALKNEEITIASFNAHHALESFEAALVQGFNPHFDTMTQQIVNQYYFSSPDDFHLVSFDEKDPKKLLEKMQKALNHGLGLQLTNDQKEMLKAYAQSHNKTELVLQGFRGVNKHNLQLMQDIDIKSDISKIDKTQLPLEPIVIQLSQKQIKGGFFSKAKKVPDLEGTLDEATRLAKLGVRMKLSPEINVMLKNTQDKLRTEMDKIKNKKKGKLSKEGEGAKALLEKYRVLDVEIKRANTPVSFDEFETKQTKLTENKTPGVSPYQDLQRQQAQTEVTMQVPEATEANVGPSLESPPKTETKP